MSTGFFVGAGLPATGSARRIPARGARAQARTCDHGHSMVDDQVEVAA